MDKLYCCRYLLPISLPPIEDAWVWIKDDVIFAFGKKSELPSAHPPIEDLKDSVILPGFVNAHSHLELGFAQGLARTGGFVDWIVDLMRLKETSTRTHIVQGLMRAYESMRTSGVVAIADHVSVDGPIAEILALPMVNRIFVEMLGVKAKDTRQASSSLHLSPHSIHALAQGTLEEVMSAGNFFSIHISESEEENACFKNKTGPLANFIRKRGGEIDHLAESPIRHLACHQLLDKPLFIVHGNTIDERDLDLLNPDLHSFVHCPGSHRYFDHPRFPLEKIEARGFRIAIGTDSWASNGSQNFLEELRQFKKSYPHKNAADILKHATLVGAQALHLDQEIGSIEVGKRALLIGFPYLGGDPYDSILCATQISWAKRDAQLRHLPPQ